MSVLKRLTVLREDADKEPLPQRKFFHIGQPEVLDDVGECIPMISWVDDNLSRFIVADGPSSLWGAAATAAAAAKGASKVSLFPLPNRAVKPEDGLFLISGAGNDHSAPHPNGKGSIHFVYLGSPRPLWDKGLTKIYIYRLEGVQFKNLTEKKK